MWEYVPVGVLSLATLSGPWGLRLVLCLSYAAANSNLVHNVFLYFFTAGSTVFLGIVGVGLFGENALYAVGEGDAQVGSVIYFADTAADAVSYIFIGYTAGAVKY